MGRWTEMEIEFYCLDVYRDMIPEPTPSFKEIPDWYRDTSNLKKTSKCPFAPVIEKPTPKQNIKSCPAVFDYLSGGYIIKAWDNFLVRNVDGHMYVNWEKPCIQEGDPNKVFNTHQTWQQMDGMLDKSEPMYGGFHKLLSPWFVKTPPGVSLYYTNPSQYRDKRFTTVDGVIHPEESSVMIQWFFEWNTSLPENVDMESLDVDLHVIKKGTPLIMLFPFKRDTYKSKVNYLSEGDYKKYHKDKTLWYTHDWFGNSLYNQFRRKLGRLFR